jgi:hypothetical protein
MGKWNLDRWIQIYNGAIATIGLVWLFMHSAASPEQQPSSVHSGALMSGSPQWIFPSALIFTGFALTALNIVLKRRSASNVESPLIRRANGMLDWKPIHFEQIANRAFVNAEITLDGKRFISCSFEHCTFVYEGTAPTELVENCKLVRRNLDEPNFIIRTSNPIVITACTLQSRISEGGPGLIGIRFEPVN